MANKQRSLREMALFAGAGGGILAGELLEWECVCAVEREPYPATVLAARQNEGVLPPFPIWDDVQTFDGRPWRGIVDVVSGGFPCQDISTSGAMAGINGARSSMWWHMLRIIREVSPEYAFIENSANLRGNGLVTVLQGLAEIGYNATWDVLSAAAIGATHERKRMWIVASNANVPQCKGGGLSWGGAKKVTEPWVDSWWKAEPKDDRVDDGVAFGVDRLKATGNGQVPAVAAIAWTKLHERLHP